jgi:acyl-ACP dehydrogenase
MTDTAELSIEEYRALLDEVFDDQVFGWTAEAEASERFSRKLIEHLGERGVFAHEWRNGQHPDVPSSLRWRSPWEGSARRVSVWASACTIRRSPSCAGSAGPTISRTSANKPSAARRCCASARPRSPGDRTCRSCRPKSVLCVRFEVRGIKKFVSLSPVADHIMAVARGVDHDENSRHGNVLVIAVPTSQTDVQLPYRKVGVGPLDTAAVHIDTWVPADALIARPGTGLAAISWGLAHERMSIAGQAAAGCQRALGNTHARMVDRKQFGSTLFEHQALRLRVADLQARVDLLRHGLNGIAAEGVST